MVQTDAMTQISNAFTPLSNASIHYGCSGFENFISRKARRSQRVWDWLHFAKKDVKNFFFRIILEELIELVVRRRSCLGRQNSDFRCVQEFDLVR